METQLIQHSLVVSNMFQEATWVGKSSASEL